MFFFVSLASTTEGLKFFVPKQDEAAALRLFSKIRKSKQDKGSVLLVQTLDSPADVKVDELGYIVKAPGAVARTVKEKVFEGA